MRHTISLIFITLLAASFTGKAQDAPMPLSLDDCMAYALRHNYTIKNARLDVGIQKAQNNQVLSSALPRINGKAEFDDYLNPVQTFVPGEFFGGAAGTFTPVTFTPRYAGSASASGSQVLFDGTLLIALKAKNTVIQAAQQGAQVTTETVKYNVQRAYYSLVIAYRQFSIIKESMISARSSLHDITVMQESGFAEKIDVDRSSVQVYNQSSDSIRIANMLVVSEQSLKYVMGMPIDAPIVLTDTTVEDNLKDALNLVGDEVDYSSISDYKLLQYQLKLSDYSLKRYQLAALPTLNVFGTMGYNYSSNTFSDISKFHSYLFNSIVGLQLNVPIFNGFMRTNQAREAKLNIEKAKNNIANLKLGIDFQQAQGRTTLRNALLQVESQQKNLDLAKSVVDLARRKYKAGVGSNQEVTLAQTELLQAQNNYFNALLIAISAQSDLQRSLGLFK
jgi:outer membrane protein